MRVVVVDPSRTVLKFVQRMLETGGHERARSSTAKLRSPASSPIRKSAR